MRQKFKLFAPILPKTIKILFLTVFLGMLAGCARSSTCSPSAYWNCIEEETSKNSCSYFVQNSSAVGKSAGLVCLNKISGNLSADEQETCKETLRRDLQKNLGSRMKQIIDSVLKKCSL